MSDWRQKMFSEQQLEQIKSIAQKKKNQGELSVSQQVLHDLEGLITPAKLAVIQYCAEECKRQHSGEMSVYDMLVAWNFAQEFIQPLDTGEVPVLTPNFIEHIGKLVEPIDNKKGFRTIPIGVWDDNIWHEKAPWDRVPAQLSLLLESYYEGLLVPDKTFGPHPFAKSAEDQFYYEYEMIHPFKDGNGRSGVILFNYLLSALDAPIMSPN